MSTFCRVQALELPELVLVLGEMPLGTSSGGL